tara:strand:- start:263 stop:550 length:288 start_codon:yes stop_codon:yes gene_type:complete
VKVFKIIGGWRLDDDDDDDDDSSSSSSSSRRFFNSRSHQTVGAQHAHAGPANVNESGLVVVVVVIFATFAAFTFDKAFKRRPPKKLFSFDDYLGF